MLLAMLICLVPAVSAAGSASLSGPGTVRAGDTITVTFYAGGGIYGGSGSVVFDSSQLTLQGYTAAIGGSWRVEFNGNNFIFYDDSMASPINGSSAIFTAKFQVSASLKPGAEIAVTASGVTLSDGKADSGAGSPAYRKTIAPPLSGNCNLASLTVSNAKISPAFSPSVTSYSASVPFATSSLQVSAKAEHAGAKVSVGSTALVAGGTTAVNITVTAENGAAKTYTIRVAREQDPNYVPSSNAQLKSLSVEGYSLSPAFGEDVQQYYVWMPYETETVKVSADKADSKAKLTVAECPELTPGQLTDLAVTVTAEDGTQKVYTLSLFRAPAPADVDVFFNGEPTEETTGATEPETEPTTEPPTEPATEPVELPEETEPSLVWAFIAVGAASAIASAGVMTLILHLIRKKKDKDLYNL